THTAKRNIIKEFQERGLSVNDKQTKIDFWYKVAKFSKNECIGFILKNDITVFTDTGILLSELYNSEVFSSKNELIEFIISVDKYSQLNGEDETIDKISKILHQFEKNRRKKEKLDIKNEKKSDSDFIHKKRIPQE
ncbi:MAG: hypothetical protein LUF02_05625, partial [Erysipelotrichaceae bacterium]|nr:hypothetical protein [Erysipelotrichaceae bacterium]